MAFTCNSCKFYDISNPVRIDESGNIYHRCKRNAPIVHTNSHAVLGTWPLIITQTPVCGEFKKL